MRVRFLARLGRNEFSAGGGGGQVSPTSLGSGNATFITGSASTASISPASNKVVYACFAVCMNTTTADDIFSVTGCGLTWVRVAEEPSTRRVCAVFRALGTASAGALTITEAQAEEALTMAYTVVQFDNANTGGTDGSGATGTAGVATTDGGTSLPLTITGSPGANDATFAFAQFEDGLTGVKDAAWDTIAGVADNGDISSLCDWDAGQDQSPTWTWGGGAGRASAIGFIVIAA